jgi:preprotein translocase SecE subunit
MRSKSTIVGLVFLSGFGLGAFIFGRTASSLMAAFDVSNRALLGENFTLASLVGVAIAALLCGYLFVTPKTKAFVNEVTDEVSKVAWPEWSETKVNTVVVILFSFVCAAILGVFDAFFSWLTSADFIL